jgi:hypothetical protein
VAQAKRAILSSAVSQPMLQSERHETYRFFDFELDVPAYALRRRGLPVKLERQPISDDRELQITLHKAVRI